MENKNLQDFQLSYKFARENGIFISDINESNLEVLISEDFKLNKLSQLEAKFKKPLVIKSLSGTDFFKHISSFYSENSDKSEDIADGLGDHINLEQLASDLPKTEDLLDDSTEAPVIRLINAVLSEAIKSNASDIHIEKIPIGYGIGGGSSNAASILKYLYKFYKINPKNFFDDAPELGSDVLLFFNQTPKIIDGIKSYRILNINKARWKKIYLIFPRTKNLTASIFSHFRKNFISEKTTKNPFRNDLLKSSLAVNPEFFDIYSLILSEKKKFSFFGMSGSGSSIFFNFDKISSERSVIQLIKQKFPLVRIEKSYYFG